MRITTHSNSNAAQLTIDPSELGKGNEGQGMGLEIRINGLDGNPEENTNPSSIFLEYYEGKVQLHVWTDNQQNPQTIVLT
jgi:hypothetical protein